MRGLLTILMSVAVLNAIGGAGDDVAKKDQLALQGSWKVISIEEEGGKLPDAEIKLMTVKIMGDKITVSDKKTVVTVSFKLDPAKTPKAIDFKILDGPEKGKSELGIYTIKGDTAKFCMNGPGKERPTEFVSKKDT